MHIRTIAVLAAAVIVPAAATAHERQCGCSNDRHAQHEAHGAATSLSAPSSNLEGGATPAYDAAQEGPFRGVVYSVTGHVGMDLLLTVGVGEGTLEVLVAPTGWLDRNNVVFRSGETVEIVGAPDPTTPKTIIAREIHTPTQTVVLRDSYGKPLWGQNADRQDGHGGDPEDSPSRCTDQTVR